MVPKLEIRKSSESQQKQQQNNTESTQNSPYIYSPRRLKLDGEMHGITLSQIQNFKHIKGLTNRIGESNCFLNVLVQALYSSTSFVDNFLKLPTMQGSPKTKSFKEIFNVMQQLLNDLDQIPDSEQVNQIFSQGQNLIHNGMDTQQMKQGLDEMEQPDNEWTKVSPQQKNRDKSKSPSSRPKSGSESEGSSSVGQPCSPIKSLGGNSIVSLPWFTVSGTNLRLALSKVPGDLNLGLSSMHDAGEALEVIFTMLHKAIKLDNDQSQEEIDLSLPQSVQVNFSELSKKQGATNGYKNGYHSSTEFNEMNQFKSLITNSMQKLAKQKSIIQKQFGIDVLQLQKVKSNNQNGYNDQQDGENYLENVSLTQHVKYYELFPSYIISEAQEKVQQSFEHKLKYIYKAYLNQYFKLDLLAEDSKQRIEATNDPQTNGHSDNGTINNGNINNDQFLHVQEFLKGSTTPSQVVNLPPNFIINIIWDSVRSQSHIIKNVAEFIEPQFDSSKVFDILSFEQNGKLNQQIYQLKHIVCFKSRHYISYQFDQKSQQWLQINDNRITLMGEWLNCIDAIIVNELQPLLLFYEQC